jgi:hypothetical protein
MSSFGKNLLTIDKHCSFSHISQNNKFKVERVHMVLKICIMLCLKLNVIVNSLKFQLMGFKKYC